MIWTTPLEWTEYRAQIYIELGELGQDYFAFPT